jgi:hypothetical protein
MVQLGASLKGFVKEIKSRKIPFDLHLLKLKPNISMAMGAYLMAADHFKLSMPKIIHDIMKSFTK